MHVPEGRGDSGAVDWAGEFRGRGEGWVFGDPDSVPCVSLPSLTLPGPWCPRV